jgi:hypothetical protein
MIKNMTVLCINLLLSQLLLQCAKEMFDRVQPGTVLGIEDHIHLEALACVENRSMFVDDGIIHENYWYFLREFGISPDIHESMIDKVLHNGAINS